MADPSENLYDAIGPSPELNRRNARWAWGLTVLFLLLFGGTFGIAFVYLWLI